MIPSHLDQLYAHLYLYWTSGATHDLLNETLWTSCGHLDLQREQLALLITTRGVALIKTGYLDELLPIKETVECAGFKTRLEIISPNFP